MRQQTNTSFFVFCLIPSFIFDNQEAKRRRLTPQIFIKKIVLNDTICIVGMQQTYEYNIYPLSFYIKIKVYFIPINRLYIIENYSSYRLIPETVVMHLVMLCVCIIQREEENQTASFNLIPFLVPVPYGSIIVCCLYKQYRQGRKGGMEEAMER